MSEVWKLMLLLLLASANMWMKVCEPWSCSCRSSNFAFILTPQLINPPPPHAHEVSLLSQNRWELVWLQTLCCLHPLLLNKPKQSHQRPFCLPSCPISVTCLECCSLMQSNTPLTTSLLLNVSQVHLLLSPSGSVSTLSLCLCLLVLAVSHVVLEVFQCWKSPPSPGPSCHSSFICPPPLKSCHRLFLLLILIHKHLLNSQYPPPLPVAQNWLRMTGSFLAAPIQLWPLGSRSWRRSWLTLGGLDNMEPGSWRRHPGEAFRWVELFLHRGKYFFIVFLLEHSIEMTWNWVLVKTSDSILNESDSPPRFWQKRYVRRTSKWD